jgi:diaminopimelate decarboxylase
MEHAQALLGRYWHGKDGELHVGGMPIRSIVAQYGTPLFLYDTHVLDTQWERLRRTFPAAFAICYSVKANPHPAILQHVLAKGGGLEIASGGELHYALWAGCPAEKILFAGPGKTEAELELALTHGIGEIHVESRLEAARIAAISRRLGRQAPVAVRVNPSSEAQGGAMRMGGKAVPFGVDEECLDPLLDDLVSDAAIDFRGLHLFSGTQILDHTLLVNQYRKGLEIARRVATRLQCPLSTLDFGGGLGIPYFANERELDMEALHEELVALMAEVQAEPLLAGTRFLIEPGRYLIGEAGMYVISVTDIKVSRGKTFLITDGGMHHHLAASGNLGQVMKRNFPIALLNKIEAPATETVDVVGPLCTPLDVLARSVMLPTAQVGDLVGVMQSGAYARTASPLGFLSHPAPAEVLVQEGKTRLIRRRGTYDDLFRDLC